MYGSHDYLKIEKRLKWLKELFYEPVKNIELQIVQSNADACANNQMELDDGIVSSNFAWGREWEYVWFKGTFEIGSSILESAGKNNRRLFLQVDTGGESLVYLNGNPIGAIDRQHKEIILSGAETVEGVHGLKIKSYAGHNIPSYEPKPTRLAIYNWRQPVYKYCRLVTRNEDAWRLYFDMAVLYGTAKELPQGSLRRIKIIEALLEAVNGIVWETDDYEKQNLQFSLASQKLVPLLKVSNSPTTPMINLIGHSHIDIAWLWPLEETIHKCGRTFATQLRLLDEYPGYRFLQSQAQAYAFTEEHYPELFAKIQKAIDEGKWEVNGGMWVESDTNLPSAESLIRQFLIGQSYFKTRFGTQTSSLWLPDVFGYSGNLPQIMLGCGIKHFITSKIGWNDTNEFPHDLFRWRGIDGTEITTLFIKNTYNSDTAPSSLWRNWHEFICKNYTDVILDSVGYGDGGGGITMEQLEYAVRSEDLEGLPKTRFGFVRDLMAELEEKKERYPVYTGELYMEHHRGTYTSQAWTKRNNRKVEFLTREAEFLAVAAALAGTNYKYPGSIFKTLWQQILTAQFHDILPGSSINKVYTDCDNMYQEVARGLDGVIDDAFHELAGIDDTEGETDEGFMVFIYNSLNWQRNERLTVYFSNANRDADKISDHIVKQPTLPPGRYMVYDEGGTLLPTQCLEDRLIFLPNFLPQLGCAKYRIVPSSGKSSSGANRAPDSPIMVSYDPASQSWLMENRYLEIAINKFGQLASLYDKEAGRHVLRDIPANRLLIAEDLPNNYDAWNIERDVVGRAKTVDAEPKVTLIASGPLEARISIENQVNPGFIYSQDIVLGGEGRRIDFETRIDWNEKHRILKVSFPLNLSANLAHYDIPGGYLARATHENTSWERAQFEVPGQKWVDLSEPDYGVALLNDCKYGYQVRHDEICLTLLKSSTAPDPTADQGLHVFTYSLYPHPGNLVTASVPQKGLELNCLPKVLGAKQDTLVPKPWVTVDSDQVWLQAAKQAEDGHGVILRLTELMGKHAKVDVSFNRKPTALWETNMLEENLAEIRIPGSDGICRLEFAPFEIKTVRVDF